MKLIADLHTHTIASGHAVSTLQEMLAKAQSLGYKAFATTDHAHKMPGSPAPFYFSNLLRLPDITDEGMLLLKGIEANVMDEEGTLDVSEKLLPRLDWVVASIHSLLVAPMDEQRVTRLWLKVAENPYVDMIGHSEQREYQYDYDRVTKAFAQHNKVVEMNANSRNTRPGNEENMRQLALFCKQNGTKIAISSDAHSSFQMENMRDVIEMLEKIDFPEERIVNTSMERLLAELALHKRPIADRARAYFVP